MLLSVVVKMAMASFYSLIDPHPGSHSRHLYSICAPNGTANNPDLPNLNYACNVAIVLSILCKTGDISSFLPARIGGTTDSPPAPVPNAEEQQQYLCASSFFDQMYGCASCLSHHGRGTVLAAYLSEDDLQSMKTAYCHSSDPKAGFSEFWKDWTEGKHAPENIKSALSLAATSSFIDPWGITKTAVSLYYTPSVTGTAALAISMIEGTITETETTPKTKTGGGDSKTTESANIPILNMPTSSMPVSSGVQTKTITKHHVADHTSSTSLMVASSSNGEKDKPKANMTTKQQASAMSSSSSMLISNSVWAHGKGNMSTTATAHKNHTLPSMSASVAAGAQMKLCAHVAGMIGVAAAIAML